MSPKIRKQKPKKLKDANNEWFGLKFEPAPPRALTKTELAKASRTECFRPDIFLTNGRHCDGCPYFNICENKLKCLPKYYKTDKKKVADKKKK